MLKLLRIRHFCINLETSELAKQRKVNLLSSKFGCDLEREVLTQILTTSLRLTPKQKTNRPGSSGGINQTYKSSGSRCMTLTALVPSGNISPTARTAESDSSAV